MVHLTSLHPALDSRIFYNQCVSLAKNRFDVTLIAPAEADFSKDGVEVKAVRPAKSRWQRLFTTGKDLFQKARRLNADLYHFHDPELIPWAALLRLSGRRVVMDVHEDQPGAMRHSRDSVPKPLRVPLAWLIDGVERTAAMIFSGVVTTTKSNARRFPKTKTAVVENFPDISDAPNQERIAMKDRANYVVFTGSLGELQCIPELVDAMGMLPAESSLRLCLGGRFVPAELEERVRTSPGWARVDFVGWQERADIYKILERARAGFVLYKTAQASPEFSSRKLYEYMAFGVPIIASNVESWANIVSKYDCGTVVGEATAQAIFETITSTLRSEDRLEQLSCNARDAFERDLNASISVRQLLELYRWILGA